MGILDKFTVVDLVKTRSASVASIFGNHMKFNNQTAAELCYAPYIQILVNLKDKQFAIRACKEGEHNALPFSKPKGEQKNPIKISSIAVVDMIRKMAGWDTDKQQSWNIPGIYFAEEQAIVYDVSTAKKPAQYAGWETRRAKQAAETADAVETEAID